MARTHHSKLLTRKEFLLKLVQRMGLVSPLIVISLLVGMLGYRGFEDMSWVDSFFNASMIMSGMGPATELHTAAGKIFAGAYAIYSGLFLIGVTGYLLIPFMHHVMHLFHEETKS